MAQPLQGAEPPMYLQRPSSARSQDIAHILAHTFRELFTRDSVGQDTVQYLHKSRGGEDEYHEKYVDSLQKVQEEHERRLAEVAMLERHIMQAQARAMSADERALNRASSAHSQFPDLGLPPSRSHFRSCIDTELLRSHNLITPEDFATEEPPIVPPPQHFPSAAPYLRQTSSLVSRGSAPSIPAYARETVASSKRKPDDVMAADAETPLPPGRSIHSSLSSDSEGSEVPERPPVQQQEQQQLQGTGPHNSWVWTQQINPEQREENRAALGNLQAKVDYLKNPRHVLPAPGQHTSLVRSKKRRPKEVGIKPTPEKDTPKDPPVIFVPSPPVVRFTDYHVGQVYEITLELKNVTGAMRPVRVVPPRTSFFAVGLGQFPGEQGLVAPGMSCHYTVRFSPDTLADYDDYLTVQTQAASPLLIPLQGRRPPPVLTLPEDINVGQCLVGGCKVGRLMVQNEGGPGRFCVMKRDSWPASNFKMTVSSTSVSLPPFEVRPAVFELDRGAQTIIEVLFSPSAVETYTESITVVCDNCHIKHFTITGEGQTAGVELTSVEGGLSAAAPDELCDVTSQHLMRFDPLNPYTYFQRAIHVKNLSNVEVPFAWVVVKPLLEPPDPSQPAGTLSTGPQERVQDVDSAFSIEPQTGSLPPSGVCEFVVTFAPPMIKKFHSVMHLILRDIPHTSRAIEERPASATSDGVSEIVLPQNAGPPGSTHDLTALEVEMKGICEPFSVMLQPYAIFIPGEILIGTTVKRQFRMINTSVSSVLFQWEKVHSSEYIMEIEPPIGELGPQEEMEFDLAVSCSRPGRVSHSIVCFIQHLEEPLVLHVQADVKGPQVQIENPDMNFGLVRLGDKTQQVVRLRNMCQVSAHWSIFESPVHAASESQLAPEFIFNPPSGELRPLDTTDVVVTFLPRKRKSLRTIFELQVEDGNTSALLVRGEVQTPQACLLSCHLVLENVYLEVPDLRQVTLLNQTLLPTYYEWGEVEGEDSKFVSISIEPKAALLGPREEVPLALDFTAHRPGPLTDLRLACHVAGMDEPVYLALSGEVLGLTVSYSTPPAEGSKIGESDELRLDLGQVQLGETPRRRVHIKNNSAISAPFSLMVEHFGAKPPTPPERPPTDHMPSKSQRRALLGRTANLADAKSMTPDRAQSEIARTMLRPGRGAAFMVEPATGILEPFGEQVIEVTGYSDMWGSYTDTLICRVENLEVVKIPISMDVSGCPQQFQMVAAQPSQKPILRFGTHISGVRPVVRQMRINNLSPFGIRLDWQVFNTDSESKQLVDLVTTFGKPFPLLDSKGQEIVPAEPVSDYESSEEEEEEVELVSRPRLPTDFIADSPDTSPAVSREPTQPSQSPTPDAAFTAETPAASVSPGQKPPPRPKVISLTLREHHGIRKETPYHIQQEQLVISAKGNSVINVSFTPLAEGDVVTGTDCMGYALGYMSLTDEVAHVEGQVCRQQAYGVGPLRLDMTAHVKPALLTIECTEEEGMQYRTASSDLLMNDQVLAEQIRVCSTRLSNHTETPLVYGLATTAPFYLVHGEPGSRRPLAQLLRSDGHTLHPRHNMMVQVGFRLSPELLSRAEQLARQDEQQGKSSEQVPEQNGEQLEVHGHERKLHFRQDLLIRFNNGTCQRLPMYASLTLPALVLSKTQLDFGICLVGQRRELQLELSNPTGSASMWSAVIESKTDACNEDTFEMTPSGGTLEAYITYVSKSKVLLKVFFTASHTDNYQSTYLFQGMLGEIPCRLEVRGQGSYDGKHEAMVNV